MEEIGELNATSIGLVDGDRYNSLRLELPRDLQNCRQDFEEGKTGLFILHFFFSQDDEDDGQKVDEFHDGYETRFMKMFANCEHTNPYCFITETVPYQFWSPSDNYNSFWEWFKEYTQGSIVNRFS